MGDILKSRDLEEGVPSPPKDGTKGTRRTRRTLGTRSAAADDLEMGSMAAGERSAARDETDMLKATLHRDC